SPIVFVHGNPTSSYLWRNVIPTLAAYGRCIALDLPGMGNSAKLWPSGPGTYRFPDMRQFFHAFMELMDLQEPVVLVLHEYGSMLGFDWASQYPHRVKGIVHMESITETLTWARWPRTTRSIARDLIDLDWMVLDRNAVVEELLPAGVERRLTPNEFAKYREPFSEQGELRRATWSLLADLPFTGADPLVLDTVERYATFMATSDIPKLLLVGNPGALLRGAPLERAQAWPNQVSAEVRGKHYLPEDSPQKITAYILDFLESLGISQRSNRSIRLGRTRNIRPSRDH
ncbi:MAG: haloalkane dehalogenase, partial [Acidimicrobiia bacterium]|nr:haloalkane dehalogenase [Acidimicrobiia bacterium]